MATREWTVADAGAYNAFMDRGLARAMKHRPHELRRLSAGVLDPTGALLALVYPEFRDRRAATKGNRLLAAILDYAPRGGPRVVLPTKRAALSLGELRSVQAIARGGVARLVLSHPGDNARLDFFDSDLAWQLPRFAARMTYIRAGEIWTLSDFDKEEPRWIRHALAVAAVLGDAVPWLRFCDLCARLFFRVKQQRWCSRRCAAVAYSRSLAKGSGPRGPAPVPFETPHINAHNAWLQIAKAKVVKRGSTPVEASPPLRPPPAERG